MLIRKCLGILTGVICGFIAAMNLGFATSQTTHQATTITQVLQGRDLEIAKKVKQHLINSNFADALRLADQSSNENFKTLTSWLVLLKDDGRVDLKNYFNFMHAHANWPILNKLRKKAERKLYIEYVPAATIINFFQQQPPSSGWGNLQLGQAYVQQGEIEKGQALIVKGFRTASLSTYQFRLLLRKYKHILSTKHLVQRANYLAWQAEADALKFMLRYLPVKQRSLYNARFILMTHSPGADYAVSKVDKSLLNDQGLIYDRMKWRRLKGMDDSAIEMLQSLVVEPNDLAYPNLWLKDKLLLARNKIYAKQYKSAYDLLQHHNASKPVLTSEAEWLSGWLALRFINKQEVALNHFRKMYSIVSYPISKSRGSYWLGRTYEALNNTSKAQKWYNTASQHGATFYGQLAADKLAKKVKLKNHSVSGDNYARFKQSELAQAVLILKQIKYSTYARDFILHIGSPTQSIENRIYAGRLAQEINHYEYAVRLAKRSSYQHVNLLDLNYPTIELPHKKTNIKSLAKEYIFALIRQESEFAVRINSYAGAKGLMQIMPSTARVAARNLKIAYSKWKLINDPEYNLRLGAHLISSLNRQFDGSLILTLAAYNAGSGRVNLWLKKIGDPREGEIDAIDFIELIPYTETRNYVQRVIENITVYNKLLAPTENEVLTSNLVYKKKKV